MIDYCDEDTYEDSNSEIESNASLPVGYIKTGLLDLEQKRRDEPDILPSNVYIAQYKHCELCDVTVLKRNFHIHVGSKKHQLKKYETANNINIIKNDGKKAEEEYDKDINYNAYEAYVDMPQKLTTNERLTTDEELNTKELIDLYNFQTDTENDCSGCFVRKYELNNEKFKIGDINMYLSSSLDYDDILLLYKDFAEWFIKLDINDVKNKYLCPHFDLYDIRYHKDKLVEVILEKYFN